MLAALEYGITDIHEYAPREAKQAITGNGAASKEQVSVMLRKTLNVDFQPEHLDATDALAIALCHYYSISSPLSEACSQEVDFQSAGEGERLRRLGEVH